MSEIKYGLISKTDSLILEKTIDLICEQFPDEVIHILEIGLFDCGTASGLWKYTYEKNVKGIKYTGIDNEKDKQITPIPGWMQFIKGNSTEVYNQIPDNSQHLLVVDANHSYPAVVADYFCFKNKVKIGGFLCFHDIAPQAQGRDWQRMGSEQDPDMFIAVRKALTEIGLLNNEYIGQLGWTKVFEEWDENDRCGGMVVFKKLASFRSPTSPDEAHQLAEQYFNIQ